MNIERRFASWDAAGIEARAGEDGLKTFTGHAAVFGQDTLIGSRKFGFLEQIDRAAFDGVLNDDVRFLHNHDPNLLLARTTNKTLRLATDATGLLSEADWADTTLARDLQLLVARGDVSQMSFAFRVKSDKWEVLEDGEFAGLERRTILEFAQLYDVSTVTYAAYPQTDAGLRGGELCVGDLCTDEVAARVRAGLDERRGIINENTAAKAALAEARAIFVRNGDKINTV